MRRTIAAAPDQSKQTVPHFYLSVTCDARQAQAAREQLNASAPQGRGRQAAVEALDQRLHHQGHGPCAAEGARRQCHLGRRLRSCSTRSSDVGVAVAVEGGLFTPVVRAAETKTLTAISTEMKDLAAKARARKLVPSEYQGGTAAISNLGMYRHRAVHRHHQPAAGHDPRGGRGRRALRAGQGPARARHADDLHALLRSSRGGWRGRRRVAAGLPQPY